MLWSLRERASLVPVSVGVYLLEDSTGNVLYVGRASNLRERLTSYAHTASLPTELGSRVHEVRTIPVDDPREAFLVEQELLRRHRPKLNVKPEAFGDLVYIRARTDALDPCIQIVSVGSDRDPADLGPYASTAKLREALRMVQKRFGVGVEGEHEGGSSEHGCAACRLARGCQGDASALGPARLTPDIAGAMRFLTGQDASPTAELRERMDRASRRTRFEEAAALRNRLEAIEQIVSGQRPPDGSPSHADVFGVVHDATRRAVQILHVRDGRVRSTHRVAVDESPFPDGEVLSSIVALYYYEGHGVPEDVLLSDAIDDAATLGAILGERTGARVRVRAPRRGPEAELVRQTLRGGERALEESPPSQVLDVGVALERLRVRLGLRRAPKHIDYFDVSHMAGSSLVATRVAMVDGYPDPSRYSRHRLATPEIDGPSALYEAVSGSIRHQLDTRDLPDWLVVEGGRQALAAATAVLRDYGAQQVQVASISRHSDPDQGESSQSAVAARIFVPGREDAIVLPGGTSELRLLDQLCEEAHRYAVQRGATLVRRERALGSLHEIPGVGETRRKRLIRHFGSVDRLQLASVDELARVPGIGRSMAVRIHQALHGQDAAAGARPAAEA